MPNLDQRDRPILVLVGGDAGLAGGVDAEAVLGVEESAEAIAAVLERAGRVVARASVTDAPSMLQVMETIRPALVVNLIESLQGRGELESAAAGLLELWSVPFTGSPPLTLALALNKPLARATLQGLGLPVAPGCVLRQGESTRSLLHSLEPLRFPCIVKPAATDASHGIEPESVVPDPAAAMARAELMWDRYGWEVVVEEFVDGREINVAIVGTADTAQCLPLSEIDFRLRPGLPRVVTYAAKWIDGSEEWGESQVLCPAPLDPAEAERIESVALAAYRGFGCRDYGRVDLRLTPDGHPILLEVNPNPDLAPSAGLARSASRKSWSYDDLILRIVAGVEERSRSTSRAASH